MSATVHAQLTRLLGKARSTMYLESASFFNAKIESPLLPGGYFLESSQFEDSAGYRPLPRQYKLKHIGAHVRRVIDFGESKHKAFKFVKGFVSHLNHGALELSRTQVEGYDEFLTLVPVGLPLIYESATSVLYADEELAWSYCEGEVVALHFPTAEVRRSWVDRAILLHRNQ